MIYFNIQFFSKTTPFEALELRCWIKFDPHTGKYCKSSCVCTATSCFAPMISCRKNIGPKLEPYYKIPVSRRKIKLSKNGTKQEKNGKNSSFVPKKIYPKNGTKTEKML
jgi:hypothetical protein